MITLLILVYIVVSLIMSHHTYNDPWIGDDPGHTNVRYQMNKKSFIYGFLFIPKWLLIFTLSLTALILFIWALFLAIGWILTNMP